ncbi:MAG: IS607 family element transposase accessory protein TnpB [Actinobacteria bacterium]|nr:IS607 family element transposase accessory protein TnpB [Actinomycetota bacterium]
MGATAPRLYGVKVALDPTPVQSRLLASHAGAARFVFNRMLAEVKATLDAREWERRLLGGALTPADSWTLPALRRSWNAGKDVWAPWWGEVSKEAFNHGLQSLADALANWADSRAGGRGGQAIGFPTFRGRRARLSFSYTTGSFRPNPDEVSVQLPRVGRVHTHERLDELITAVAAGEVRIIRATISHSRGRWWCSFTVEDVRDVTLDDKPHAVVGVDAGVVDLLVVATPDGHQVLGVPAPKPLADAQAKLRRLQRRAARQQRGSGRWRRTMRRVGKTHARVANLRADTIHKATTAIAKMADTVVIEDLNTKAMAARKPGAGNAGRGFNRAVADAALGECLRQLAYKTAWYGGTLIRADRWYPSSKTCSSCGSREPKLPLDVRHWTCTSCGAEHDRDRNAATNLAHLAVCTSCRQWGGDAKHGRGATHQPCAAQAAQAGGRETSTQPDPTVHNTGTATPQEVAA